MNKKTLSERDICTKFITPHLIAAGWDIHSQVREEVSFTDGRIHVRGKVHTRGTRKRADYILYYKPNIPIARRKRIPPPAPTGFHPYCHTHCGRCRFDIKSSYCDEIVTHVL